MSYILEALKKEQTGQGQTPSLQTHSVPVAIETRSASIAWGVLLTLAIFSALLAGYWLGQNNHQGQVFIPSNIPAAEVSAAQPSSQTPMSKAAVLEPAAQKDRKSVV